MSRTDGATYRQADPDLLDALEQAAPGAVSARATERLGLAHDASHYLLTPQAVVTPTSAAQVGTLLRTSASGGFPLTFRSGGTSLSGQAVSGSVLVDTRRHFREIEVLDDGARVRVQPGATVRQVNSRLAPYGTKLGPDPASESACTIGGVVANNSSGMACGTELNSYRTLTSLVLVLPSGTVVDTSRPDADEALRFHEPELHDGLLRLRDRVRSDPESCRVITQQFSLKNTMGYGLNSFLDHSSPTQILAHLAVGSEGTLAFVAEATFRTVPIKSHAATALLVFPSLRDANDALPALVGSGLATIELLDAASLRVAQQDPLADSSLRGITVLDHAALLVEHQELSDPELVERMRTTSQLLEQLPLAAPVTLSRDTRTRAGLWHIRKGLYAAVAGSRPSGTTALLEDIAVPVASLARTCEHLVELFVRHGYQDSVIFGHAKDGNVHFMLTERFDRTDRYLSFTEDMVDLVLGENGTLKAEHGTGRIMAPFVRRQYGDELYEVMLEVKRLCDPAQILNPGVLLNPDPLVHVQHLKATPTVEPEVDRCVECGYCEPVCPSKDLTLTPRQRIVLRREMVTAQAAGDAALVHELESQYEYDGVATCAVDGMCQTACPVLINTGDLVKRLRAQDTGRVEQSAWKTAAGHWDLSTRAAARSLDVAAALPPAAVTAATAGARRVFGDDRVPLWEKDVPGGGVRRRPVAHPAAQAVYLPSCTGTMFAPAEGCAGVRAAVLALCGRADVAVTVPADVAELCCGTPWRSKGFEDGYRRMRNRVLPALWEATAGGRLPVVSDATSCTEGFEQMVRSADPPYDSLVVVDAVDFTLNEVVPRLTVERRLERVVLHPTCASTRLGANDAMTALAALIADDVVVPQEWGCCAFAGDRGLLHPELTASATAGEARSVRRISASAYASSNRTCEIGMTRATGEQYQHLLELVDDATRPAQSRSLSTRLEASTLPRYLVDRGLVGADERVVVEELTGGVSCSVFGVETPTRSLVVKQALPQLRVAAEWHADPERAGNEAAALRALSALTPTATPALLDEDPAHHVLAMTRAPAQWQTWKQQLLAGHVDTATSRRLGTVLGTWHSGTRTASALPARFLDLTGFHQLRIAPYYRTVQQRHPAHAEAIDKVVQDMLAHRSCLAHGDFSPKNVLVGETGSWVIDFEVAHYGDPTFDVAFLLTHLVLKAAHLPTLMAPLRACAHEFLKAYVQTVSPDLVAPSSRLTDQLGCLLLARVDGSSPAEYLTPEQQIVVRSIALALVEQRLHDLDDVFAAAGGAAR